MASLGFAGRLYLLTLMTRAVPRMAGNPVLQYASLGIILGLSLWRFRREEPWEFLPDPILAGFPFFWSLNILLQRGLPPGWHLLLHGMLFAWASLRLGPEFIARRQLRLPLSIGIFLSALFFFGFMTGLKIVFPPFELGVFRHSLLNGLWFYSTIPIAVAALSQQENPSFDPLSPA